MSVLPDNQDHAVFLRQLNRVQEYASGGRFNEALASVEKARDADPRNIYVVAIQKQIEKLRDIAEDSATSIPQRSEILRTLEAIVARAAEVDLADSSSSTANPTAREEALEDLRKSFLQRADEYLSNGDLDRALAEVKRIYILHPHDPDADRYEKRIKHILGLQNPATAAKTLDSTPGTRAETESPFVLVDRRYEIEEDGREGRKKTPSFLNDDAEADAGAQSRPLLFVLLAAAIIAVIVIFFYVFSSGHEELNDPTSRKSLNEGTTQGGASLTEEVVAAKRSSEAVLENIPINPPKNRIGGETNVVKPLIPSDNPSNSDTSALLSPEQPGQIQMEKINPIASINTRRSEVPLTFSYVEAQQPPEVKRLPIPEYPELARQSGAEGTVRVQVQVSAEGKPLQARILDSSNPIFNEAAINAVLKAEFIPGKMPSGPVISWVTLPLTFRKPE